MLRAICIVQSTHGIPNINDHSSKIVELIDCQFIYFSILGRTKMMCSVVKFIEIRKRSFQIALLGRVNCSGV